jgi:hypothetical protein
MRAGRKIAARKVTAKHKGKIVVPHPAARHPFDRLKLLHEIAEAAGA